MDNIIIPLIVMGGTGTLCAGLLAVASRIFAVHEDPRIAEVAELLPGVNCGGCGYAGCSDYAKAVVKGDAALNLCAPGGEETVHRIAAYMGVEAVIAERRVAIVLCAGDDSRAVKRAAYNGVADCRAAELLGGGKMCRYGCLGLGSCARACPVNAIEITSGNIAVVHPESCIGCGKCVNTCPRGLIKLVPAKATVHIPCSSKDRGPVVKKACSVGCIGCTRCVKAVNGEGISMDGALAVVDYTRDLNAELLADVCPQKTVLISGHPITEQVQ